MRGDIQFAKIDVKNRSRLKQTALVFFGFLLLSILSFFSVLSVRAYFTATSNRTGELSFGEISVALVNASGGTISKDNFKTSYLSNILPGSTLNFNDITVKNTGDFDEYVLLNVDVTITPKSGTALHYNEWYNIDGYKVNNYDFSINSAEASLLSKGGTATTNIKWTIPGEVVTNTYQKGTTAVTITAYGTQTNLPEAKAYQDKELYASYFICKNATNIAETTPSKNLLDPSAWSTAKTYYGITMQYLPNEDCFVFDGTANYPSADNAAYFTVSTLAIPVIAGDNYALSTKYVSGSVDRTNAVSSKYVLAYFGTSTTLGSYSNWKTVDLNEYDTEKVAAVTNNYITALWFYISNGVVFDNYKVKIQLEEGSTATNYVPYTEASSYLGESAINDPLRIINNGKNLFDTKTITEGKNLNANTGELYTSTVRSVSDYILVKANQAYFVNLGAGYQSIVDTNSTPYFVLYNSDLTYYGEVSKTIIGTGYTFISPINGFVRVNMYIGMEQYVQVEEGSTATTYEAYSGVKDTIDFTNQTITRNVGKYEFTGDENWQLPGSVVNGYSSFRLNVFFPSNNPMFLCSHFNSINNVQYNHYQQNIVTSWPNSPQLIFMVENGIANSYNQTSVAEWKAWLKEQYEAGNPVTIWYQLETPVTEKFFASKNLYDGEQYLHCYNSAADDNISYSGLLTISKNQEKNTSGTTIELGKDLFSYLYDKPITISFKIKVYADDVRTNPASSMFYITNATTGARVASASQSHATFTDEDKWYFVSLSLPAISSYEGASDVTQIKLWLHDYGDCPFAHYAITDLQIEVGTVPTDFENYDQTVYARVNDVELRQFYTVKDTYNASTKTITRNVGKIEFTGNETGWWLYTAATAENKFCVRIPLANKALGYKTSYCSHFDNVDQAFHPNYKNETGIYTDHETVTSIYFRAPKNHPEIDTDEEWKAWLKEQYEAGNPVTVWYQLATATTETLS